MAFVSFQGRFGRLPKKFLRLAVEFSKTQVHKAVGKADLVGAPKPVPREPRPFKTAFYRSA
jgi:hypothetical protein